MAGWIAGAYALVAILWVILSEGMSAGAASRAGGRLFPEGAIGAGVVVLTALLLYGVVRWILGKWERERLEAETMLDQMPGVFFLLDREGRYLRWNCRHEEVTGYTGAAIVSMHPTQLVPESYRSLVASRMEEVFEKGEATIEAPLLAKSGKTIPYLFVGRRVEIEGSPCLVGEGIDITARVETEEALRRSEERNRGTLESILEGCQIVGFDWTYLYVNRAVAKQNRRPGDELLGRTVMEVWPGVEKMAVFQHLRRCMEEREAYHGEAEFTFPDGSCGRFDVRVEPVPEGIAILSIEITERRAAEQALKELNESLEVKIAERTTELSSALLRAESADRLKSAFLATMSHELRTPLNSIIGFTGILLQELAGPLNPEQSKQLGMVQGSAKHLLELINDILDLSKIEAGQFEIRRETFDPGEAAGHVVANLRPLADKKGLTLTLRTPPAGDLPLTSDRRRVEQILLNLLSNAIKFTERGSVSVEVRRREGDDSEGGGSGTVSFRISDTGIGIPAGEVGEIFEPFRQVDDGSARSHEGTGLGLAICQRLVDLLGGGIEVESEVGRGSAFTFVLPQIPAHRA